MLTWESGLFHRLGKAAYCKVPQVQILSSAPLEKKRSQDRFSLQFQHDRGMIDQHMDIVVEGRMID